MRDHKQASGRRRAAALGLLTLAAGTVVGASGPAPMPLGQALKAAASAPPALAAKTEALIAAGDAPGLGRQLAALKAAPELSEPARERLLRRTLLGLANLAPDPDTRRAAAALTDYRSSTRILDAEHGHGEERTLFDVGAAARFAQRRWAETDAREAAADRLADGTSDLLADYLASDEAHRRGILEAYRKATADELAAHREALMDAVDRGDGVGVLALEAAVTLRDEALLAAVLARAEPRIAVNAVARLAAAPPGLDSTALLIAATDRPAAASAALLALGPRSADEPAAAAVLFERLGTDDGASAAAALARSGDPGVVARLAGVLFASVDARARRHALLGLRLADGPEAASQLRRFAADPGAPASLREEVPAWLRD